MALETGTYISDLNSSNPAGSDGLVDADNHMRLIKSCIKATFPNINAAVNATPTELNYVVGVTSAIQTQLTALSTNKADATTTTSALALKAPLASPVLTGTPAAPTATAGTNTTQLATTAFVATAVGAVTGATPTGSVGDLQTKATSTTFGSITPGTNVAAALAVAINAASGLVRLDASSKLPAVDGSALTGISGMRPPDVIVEEQQTSGTAATEGAFGGSSIKDRTLNTLVANVGSIASLASSIVTLSAGTYYYVGYTTAGVAATGAGSGNIATQLYNSTDAAVINQGLPAGATASGTTSGNQARVCSVVSGKFTIAASKGVRLRSAWQLSGSGSGTGGAAMSSGTTEVYSQLQLWKTA